MIFQLPRFDELAQIFVGGGLLQSLKIMRIVQVTAGQIDHARVDESFGHPFYFTGIVACERIDVDLKKHATVFDLFEFCKLSEKIGIALRVRQDDVVAGNL